MALPVYRPCLWIMMEEKASGDCVGCAMALYDSEAREVSLEWVQVLPEYRYRQIGKAMVCRVLSSMRGTARFATVSGKLNSSCNPQALYRSCGFSGDDVWHILRES
ncbi:MAG: GNAT family N-acetyltransferase [Oscillospiraceae bacterium]